MPTAGTDTKPTALATVGGSAARDRTLHALFDARASAQPHALAAVDGEDARTYGELKSRSDALASVLRRSGISPGDRVAVCGSRGIDAIVAFLGILKAGGAYVPLDEATPPARLQAMADDAGVLAAVTLPGSTCRIRRLRTVIPLPGWQQSHDTGNPPAGRAIDCAYVMFTSGSTGRPKPVAIPHRGVVQLAVSNLVSQRPRRDDRVLQAYGLSSDASTIEIWSALVAGACLVMIDREDLLSPASLERKLRAERVTIAYLTTSVFHHVARTRPQALRTLRFASAGGEAMDADLARAVMRACPDTTIVNFYGPTENSVVTTAYAVRDLPPDATSVPIGRPLEHCTCHVLRPDGTAAGTGEEGDLVIGGDGLALGYLGDPKLTEQRFSPSPFERGARVYRTGDRAVWLANGDLEYRGRSDRQVKLHGQRIELDGIEARIRAHEDVGEVVVELFEDKVIGFVTPARPDRAVPVERVRQDLAGWLQPEAVPARLVELPAFPMTGAGKVDRARLLADFAQQVSPSAPPQDGGTHDGIQSAVGRIWQVVLRIRPAATDNFFDIGGASLLAAEVVTRTLAVFGIDARHGSDLIRSLLEDPTLAGFTSAVRATLNQANSDTRGVGIDFAAEGELGFRLPARRGTPPRWRDPRHVLLTGATGFIGAYLLHRLLRRTSATVHCPVRARDRAHATRRVMANLARYGLDPGGAADRIVCFPADLSEPRLGVTGEHAAELAGSLDLIIHSGALANFLYPYEALRPSNVDCVRELVRLAAERRVPVHFLSTIAVVAGFGTAGVRHVDEDVPLAYADRLTMGYAESKWVAEQMLRDAADQGLPVAVYRPYEVTGDQSTGACNTETAICSLFKTVAQTGLAPDIPLPMDFVPVDYVADAIVHIATNQPATRRTYHLTNPAPATFADMLARMRAAGFEIDELPYSDWVDELVRHVAENPTSPTAPFVSLCVDRGNHVDFSVKEMYFEDTFPRLGRSNVESDLAGSGLRCPPVDDALLDRYLEYFFASGYLRRPDTSPRRPTLNEMYGYAYRRAHEIDAKPDHTTLTYQSEDGSTYAEDVSVYFDGPESWWTVDAMACERAAGRVLAIGCGVGRHALQVARAGNPVIGLETSADAVAVARQRGLDTRQGSLLDIPEGLSGFDTFLLAGGGLHLLFLPEHGLAALDGLAAVARPGARIIGTCPLPDTTGNDPIALGHKLVPYRLRVTHGDEVTPWSEWGAVAFGSPEDLVDMVRDTRWEVEEIHRVSPPEMPSYLAVLRLRST